MADPHILEKIKNNFILSKRDTRYKLDAYSFLLQGLHFNQNNATEKRHINCLELVTTLVELSKKIYGPLAKHVLSQWGIHRTSDIGYIMYNLIELNVVCKHETDTLEDFFSAPSLNTLLAYTEYSPLNKILIRQINKA